MKGKGKNKMITKEELAKINKGARKKHSNYLALFNKTEKKIADALDKFAQDPNSFTHEEAEELLDDVRYKEELDTKLEYLTTIIQLLNEFLKK